MRRGLILLAVMAGVVASTAQAALTLPGYYWPAARMDAAFRYAAWSEHSTDGVGLHCGQQGAGVCNFTIVCTGLAANPSTTPTVRDVLRVGPHRLRFRYFSCVASSACFASGSWRQQFRTNTALPAQVVYDSTHIRQVGGADPVASGSC